MKTLKNQTLLYDEDCPLCRVYTDGFVKTKMLDANGRKPFHQISEDDVQFVDLKRATNEIALIDNKNKTVIYGVDSLLKIIGNTVPWIEKIGKTGLIYFMLKKLYAFVSYNRKVIIPSDINDTHKMQCIPKYNIKYRLLYILFCVLTTTFVLFEFSKLLTFLPKSSIFMELILATGQIGFQSIFLLKKSTETIINYFGNLMTVSLMGSILLMPLLIWNSVTNLPELIILAWFGMTIILMFLEHFRRVKLLQLPNYLCHTWVIYRFLALILILNLIS